MEDGGNLKSWPLMNKDDDSRNMYQKKPSEETILLRKERPFARHYISKELQVNLSAYLRVEVTSKICLYSSLGI